MLGRSSFAVLPFTALALVAACGETPPPADASKTTTTVTKPASSNGSGVGATSKMACEGATIKTASKEYCVVKDRRPFEQASAECTRMHGRLAVLDKPDEAKAFAAQLVSPWGYGSALWLGCSDGDDEGKWKCNGQPLSYTNWAPGKPDNETALDDCVQWLADTGLWNDASCASKLGYVCKGDASMKCTGKKVTAGATVFCARGDDAQDWDAAKKACETAGGKLAVPANADESRALEAALKLPSGVPSVQPGEGVWIGLSDLKEEGKWRWSTDAALAGGTWLPGQPDDANGGEDCATLTLGDGRWNDVDCIRALPYVCEAN
jgi:hypothetical protein